jgi:hypothetical protein
MPVNLAASNLRVRCGTVDDLTNLVDIYVQLGATAKGLLWADVMSAVAKYRVKDVKAADGTSVDAVEWLATLPDTGHPGRDQCAHAIVRIRRLIAVGLCGSASEVTALMEVYKWPLAWTEGDCSVLLWAVRAMARIRVHGLVDADGEAVDAETWLNALAKDAYPDGDLVADLLGWAKNGGLDIDEIFSDNALDMVLSEYTIETKRGIEMYENYSHEISLLSGYPQPPTAAEFFGIKVKEADYRTFDGDEWVVDEDARQEEVDRLCAEHFIRFFGYWRDNFFAMLISGKQPEGRGR